MIKFALTGNPNVGKTSLYNRVTHSLEHVGNWHGVTVEKKEKIIMYDHNEIAITDLPGFYSLTVYSPEEGISRDCILGGSSDMVINICEVNNLSRNLYLTLQLLELDVPLVLVINMMDELKKQGKVLNYRNIERVLKIPIVPMSAKYHSDVHLMMDVALDHLKNPSNAAELSYLDKLPLNDVMTIIGGNAAKAGIKPRYAAIKVLENDAFIIEKLGLSEEQRSAIASLGDWQSRVAQYRYEFIDEITLGAIKKTVVDEHHEMHEHTVHNVPIEEGEPLEGDDKHTRHHNEHSRRDAYMGAVSKIDRVVLNKYLALPLFLLIMALIFVITFGLVGQPLSSLMEKGFDALSGVARDGLSGLGVYDWLVSLVCDGIIGGVGGVLVFLPQIVLLFLFLALMEDSGYISRVAFMTDGFFRKIGLSGRSAFTLLMGFGCSATAILTARGLEDEKMRKKTVLLTPFMSCSARLPVYSAIAGKFFFGGSPFIIFGLYILGAVISLSYAAIFEKVKGLKSGRLSFIMEMPPYRFPTFERVLQLIWHNVKVFLIRVGTTIFALNVIIWALSSFSFTHGYVAIGEGYSIMEKIAGFIAPVFRPLGFGNWRAVTALISGLAAKEGVISTINSLGEIADIFTGNYASLSAICFMVFTLLYVPCFATISAMLKEIGFKWTAAGFAMQILTAYVMALLVRGLGILYIEHTAIAVSVTIAAVVLLILFFAIRGIIKNRGKCSGCGGNCGNCKQK